MPGRHVSIACLRHRGEEKIVDRHPMRMGGGANGVNRAVRKGVQRETHVKVMHTLRFDPPDAAKPAEPTEHAHETLVERPARSVRPEVMPIPARRDRHGIVSCFCRIETSHEPFAYQQPDRCAVGNPVVIHHAGKITALLLNDERTKRQCARRREGAVHLVAHERFQRLVARHAKRLGRFAGRIDPVAFARDMHRADPQRAQRLIPFRSKQIDICRAGQMQRLRRVVGVQRIPLPKDALKDIEPDGLHFRRQW